MEFIDLKKQYEILKEDIDKNIQTVLDNGQYIMGDFIKELEVKLAQYVGVKHCISCANGTDALSLSLMAWDVQEGDAVFVPSFTFYSTSEVVSLLGATPIFVDSDANTFNIDPIKLEKAIVDVKNKTMLTPKVVIPVDLFGLPANYSEIEIIARKYNLYILEDGAQGFGGNIMGEMACSFGDLATTSFFPAKPLGCYGDGGAIFTNNDELYDILNSLRIHGKGRFKYDNIRTGMNSRLDTIQAAILLPKLEIFKSNEITKRNEFADLYTKKLNGHVETPYTPKNMVSSWAQYTIKLPSKEIRNTVQEYLTQKGIPSMVYYPIPLHKQQVYAEYDFNNADLKICENLSDQVLSLPIHPYLSEVEIDTICATIIECLNGSQDGR